MMKNKKLILILLASFFIQSCLSTGSKEITVTTVTNETKIDSTEGSCNYLTKDNKGNVVLSWVKKIDSSHSVFCYAVSKDSGKSFGKVISVPGSENVHPNGENMPKIVFKPSGEIIAAWPVSNPSPKNKYSDIVYYAQSFDSGNTWSETKKLVSDRAGYDQRYFDMSLLSNGEVGITWLDNRKKTDHNGSALYFAATEGKTGFKNERIIGEPSCECCRTALLVDSKSNVHVVFRAIIQDSIRDMMHMVSSDNGNTFSKPMEISHDEWVINGCPHTGPAMCESNNGIDFSWFTGGDNAGVYSCRTSDNGQTYSPRKVVSDSRSRHSQMTALGKNVIIVWNQSFVEGKQVFIRIGIDVTNENGKSIVHKMITSENGSTSFPVIKPLNDHSALIAYTTTENNKDYVAFKTIEIGGSGL
ncbi:MAG: sialidase family protein [Ginsengibacter sp.]